MPFSVWFGAAAISCAVPLAWWAVAGTRVPAHRVRENLAAGFGRFTDLRTVVLQRPASERVVRPTVASLARRARRLTPAGVIDALEKRIQLAGLTEEWPLDRILAMKFVLGAIAAVFGLMVFVTSPSIGRLALAVLVIGIAFYVPDALISIRADDRQQDIRRRLADALDQITVCVEAGLSFDAAMARVAANRDPLADEFARTLQDMQLGMPRDRALQNLLDRTDIPDLRAFVHAFTHAERYGIPIANVLRVQSTELRERRRADAEERAQKIPVKLTFPLVLCILPALFVVLVGPAGIRIAHAFGIGG